jgi:hypothetical protein
MRKSFFFIFIPLVLSACQNSSLESSLEEDRKALFGVSEDKFSSSENYFSYKVTKENTDNEITMGFTLYDAKQDYHKVKVLLTYDNENSYFFGYNNSDYSIVRKEVDQDKEKKIYHGFTIHFPGKSDVEKINVYFKSSEVTFYFKATL